jgi:hypothetical protein
MTHSTEFERTIVPRGCTRAFIGAAWPIGNPCAISLRNMSAVRGTGQMWRRAIVNGGDS